MKVVLFDDESWGTLRPLTFTRPIAELRVGILTIREKWEKRLNCQVSFLTEDYLQEKYPMVLENDNLLISSTLCPNDSLLEAVLALLPGEMLLQNGRLFAFRAGESDVWAFKREKQFVGKPVEFAGSCNQIVYPYHIFSMNGAEIVADFNLLTVGRESVPLDDSMRVRGRYPVFVEPGAIVRDSIINTDDGPVYIAEGAEIMEGVLIRGPLALCEHGVLKMGAKVYGATTIGPYCKCGGEVNNVVMMAYSNKAHDGFLGNAVLGEWCNLGAATNNSNLKNTYVEVKLWDYATGHFRKTGLQFCGLIMGDHSKTGIGVILNTGTVVGVGVNIFGADFPRNFIPSFSWGGASGFVEHKLSQFFTTAEAVMKRRGRTMDEKERRIIEHVFADENR